MDSENTESTIYRAIIDSVGEFRRLFTSSIFGEESNEIGKKVKTDDPFKSPEFLDVVPNQCSVTINFQEDRLDFISEIISSRLRLCKTNAKNGSIFKTADGSATVTLYNSTQTVHVQGSRYVEWTKEFIQICEREDEKRENSIADLATSLQITHQMTSTPRMRTSQSNTSQLTQLLATLNEEVFQLRQKVDKLERSNVVSSKSVAVQTSLISTSEVSVGTEISCKSRHTQCDLVKSVAEQTETKSVSEQTETKSVYEQTETKSVVAEQTETKSVSEQTETKSVVSEQTETKSTAQPVDNAHTDGSTLIIGSSILQRISTRGLRRGVKVKTMRGAQISDIRMELLSTNVKKYDNIIIQGGGNDVSNNRDIEEIEDDFVGIIEETRKRSPGTQLYLAEVTPRCDADVTEINSMMRGIAIAYSASIVETSRYIPSISKQNHWKDDLHLSDRGTWKLLNAYNDKVLILKEKTKSDSCFYCGERGHNTDKCRHGMKIQCYNCGNVGHKYRNCRYYGMC